ncbi:hypothetical protein COV23_00625 [Candidatus Wolfebacteria bacterium CG10_big_fil_rev_8_21_14_0_10_31_9]|uniref:Small-conductance mechanosensitive ion channel n=1 Tax=Candidatus Wolfebacteria bacterium CG10_big_fil_rev_8_21_14_0_10_31_9 TaxID=1975070 RepID=A0A2H0RCQ0_9BACT|nr:MAG: hypothetical protein COV23_00625 [Candidatus Wolfebacteria bacterium CG10_big_fil_rev_8_21_14_0_10_31_9]
MFIQSMTSTLFGALIGVWYGVASFIPKFIGAIIVLIIGLIVAAVFESVIEQVIRSIKLDSLLKKIGVATYVERGGIKMDSGKFLGKLVYWFFVIVFILAVANILGLEVFSDFLKQVLFYVPNIVVMALILVTTFVVANFLKKTTSASVMSAKLGASNFLGTFVWWVVIIFGLVTALMQVGVNVYILQTIITGVVAMLALAGGLSFGLAGKDYASRLIERLKEITESK